MYVRMYVRECANVCKKSKYRVTRSCYLLPWTWYLLGLEVYQLATNVRRPTILVPKNFIRLY